jgi:hypothetical protein
MFVKPAENKERPGTLLKVRIPRTHAFLKDEGEEVADIPYWYWMRNMGDVVLADPPKPEAEPNIQAEGH